MREKPIISTNAIRSQMNHEGHLSVSTASSNHWKSLKTHKPWEKRASEWSKTLLCGKKANQRCQIMSAPPSPARED